MDVLLLSLSIRLLIVGLVVDTINSLANYNYYYSFQGLFDYNHLKNIYRTKTHKFFLSKLEFFISNKNFKFLLYTRLILCLILFFYPIYCLFFIGILFLIQLLFNLRNKVNLSGADQMRIIVLFGLTIISFGINDFFLLGYLFIVINLFISYFFTGYHKVRSPIWRNGNALIMVLNSELFGNEFLQNKLIKAGGYLNLILCWSIILFQITFPILASFNETVLIALILGFCFHLTLALIMNLNDFFWTFISAYPIVYLLTCGGII